MSWLERRSLRSILLSLVLGPMLLTTVISAATAVRSAKRAITLVAQDAPDEHRESLLATLQGRVKGSSRNDGALAMALMVVGAAFALWSSHALRQQIRELRDVADRLSRGNLDDPIVASGGNDLDQLMVSLDHMRVDLRESVEIAARTAELEHDLTLSAQVQARFMPGSSTLTTGPYEMSAHYTPADQCGGDWWWVDHRKDGSVLLVVGDVTGHGAGAALVTTSMATALQCLLRSEHGGDLGAVLQTLSQLLRDSTGGRYQMALTALELQPNEQQLRVWSAGAPPVLIDRGEAGIHAVGAAGNNLGDDVFKPGERTVAFGPGDRLLVFTDGVSELSRADGRQLGLRRLRSLFQGTSLLEPEQARQGLASDLDAERGGAVIEDDVTFLVVDCAA